jgi:DNA-binding transcriptional regulator YdaS (Cro superfamily)
MFRMTALQRAIGKAGSQSALARSIDCAPQVINNWLRRNNVPAEHCPEIEKATNGAVRCEDLRPDVDWAYLRSTNISSDRTSDDRRSPEPEQEAA